jgi:prepilin-type N-terminal cleavage/methylation domain-containing protein
MSSAVRRGGFTLIEMLTVVAIFGVVAMYVGRILIVNEHAYHTVENTSESQQNLRVFGELIEDELRHAGMMVSRDAAVCGRDYTNAPDILYVSDAAAIDPEDEEFDPWDGPTATGATNLNTGSPFGTAVTLTLSSLIVEPSPPSRPAYDTDLNGTADSDFRLNGGVIVFDPGNLDLGNACGRITAVDLANSRITVTGVAALAAAAASLVAVPANEYFVNGTQLLWNSIPLADGIEDFQVAYVFDFPEVGPPEKENGNNVIDAGETRGFSGVTAYTSSELEPHQMREIEVGLVSRSRLTDATFAGRPQALLNRAAITTADGFRRRTFQTRVLLRNLATRIDS